MNLSTFRYEFMGLIGGYFAGRLYKTMKGKDWKKAAFLTSTLYPGQFPSFRTKVVVLIVHVHDYRNHFLSWRLCKFLHLGKAFIRRNSFHNNGILHISFLCQDFLYLDPSIFCNIQLSMGAMWFGISLPLVYIGYYFGYRKQPYDQPVRTNQIPRQVPTQIWYMNPGN